MRGHDTTKHSDGQPLGSAWYEAARAQVQVLLLTITNIYLTMELYA